MLTLALVLAVTVPEAVSMSDTELSASGRASVTGVVSGVFTWQRNSCILVSPEDPNGPAIYVGGMMPGCPWATLKGAAQLRMGDEVVVRGGLMPMLLEPGVRAEEIEVTGHRELPPAPRMTLPQMRTGRYNNRRMTVEGVLWGTKVVEAAEGGEISIFRVGTPDGPITVHYHGAHPDLAFLRDRKVRLRGLCIPMCNARGEFLDAELEALSYPEILDVAAAPVRGLSGSRGVMAGFPFQIDGHLRRAEGEVVYRDLRTRFFVILMNKADDDVTQFAVRVNVDGENPIPPVGAFVEVEGFPSIADGIGVIEEGCFRSVRGECVRHGPYVLAREETEALLNHSTEPGVDYHYRYVKVRGRLVAYERHSASRIAFTVETDGGLVTAELDNADGFDESAFEDLPLVDLVGVLDIRLERSPSNWRLLSVGAVRLLLRGPEDVILLPDADSRNRRMLRISRTVLAVSAIPLVALLAGFVIFAWKRRGQAAAVAKDRKRLAGVLHDTISQHLAGARLLLYSVQSSADALPESSRSALGMAGDVLESARREVRDAILGLQGDDVMVKDAERLLKDLAVQTNAVGRVRVRTRFRALPSDLDPTEKTDLLSIVQESITNAVRHGKAKNVIVVSDPVPGGWRLSVLNDGAPFDAAAALGPETGHFGLSGMRERAARSGFRLAFGAREGYVEVKVERIGR